jgi:zinc transport system ATP-binding protein
MADKPIIVLANVSFAYNDSLVIRDVDLTIAEKEFTWVVGPNGGGKTTLVKLILGLLTPCRGFVTVFDQSPAAARRRIGYMPQQAHLDTCFPITAFEVALMGRLRGRGLLGPYSKKDRRAATYALEQVGIGPLAGRLFSELSGGELQRLLIARALASEPEVLILDEPTASLDRRAEREFLDLLHKLNESLAVILVSHDPAFVSGSVESVVCVNQTVTVHPTTTAGIEILDELFGKEVRLVRHDLEGPEEGDAG